MGSVDFAVVTRVESLTVASLFEAYSGARARVFAACSIILISFLPTRSCERKGNNFVTRLSDGVKCIDFRLGLWLSSDYWWDNFLLVLALRADSVQIVSN